MGHASYQQLQNSTWPWFGALEIGLRRPLHVREERLSTRHDACRLLYVSDIHLRHGRSETLCRQLLDAVAACSPDVVLLGGDLVDQSSELGRLSDLVGVLRRVASVLAIGGNHDQQLEMNRVRQAVEHGGGHWIHDGTARVTHGERMIAVSGPDAEGPLMGMSVSCALTTRESGKRSAMPAMTSSWQDTFTAVRWSPANIETACFRVRGSTPTVS